MIEIYAPENLRSKVVRFYCNTLMLKATKDKKTDRCVVFFSGHNPIIRIFFVQGDYRIADTGASILVTDVLAALAHLEPTGIVTSRACRELSFKVRDPAGNEITIAQAAAQ